MATDTVDRPAVPSTLPDIRGVPLADMPGLDADTLGEAIGRILPEVPSMHGAAFNSAI